MANLEGKSFLSSFIIYISIFRFGYADFANEKIAQKAMKALSGMECLGREVRLDFASNNSTPSTTPRGRGKQNTTYVLF